MENMKFEALSKKDIEQEIVDLNTEILDLEQRLSQDDVSADEFVYLYLQSR